MTYSIGEFSKLVSLSIDTLRYYEKENMITPQRDQSNRRIYTEMDVHWVEFLKKLKLTDMPIKKMKEYALLRADGTSTIEKRLFLLLEQQKLLAQRKVEIDHYILFLDEKISIYQEMLLQ